MKKNYLIGCLLAGALGMVTNSNAQVSTQTFTYTGAVQNFTIPLCVSQVTITCYGAQGAAGATGGNGSLGGNGGLGAVVSGVYTVTAPNPVFNIFVGGAGLLGVGGYNGGGNGGLNSNAGAGGGSSDVRVGGILNTNRVIVAGGGGGGGNGGCLTATVTGGNGGFGGGGNGANGTTAVTTGGNAGGGFGGVGITGGTLGIGCPSFSGLAGANGSTLGIGGAGGNGQTCCCTAIVGGGGGGGGYIGGGAGGGGSAGTSACSGNDKGAGGGGAGGTNFFGPSITTTLSAINGTNTGNGQVVISYNVATPTIVVNSGAVCVGQSFTMVPTGATSYTFSSGSAVVTPTSNASYSVTGSTIPGCIATNTAVSTIAVNALPVLSATSNASLICVGQTASLTAGGANTYTWNTAATSSVIAVSPSVTTSYSVTGTNTNGCNNSATITQSVSACTGIDGIGANVSNPFQVFPNPNNGDFTISANSDMNLSIVNNLGQVVKTVSVNASNNYKVSISNLANGIYFVVGKNNDQTIKQRIVVTK